MKKAVILLLVIAISPFFGYSQSIENVDYISPYHNVLQALRHHALHFTHDEMFQRLHSPTILPVVPLLC